MGGNGGHEHRIPSIHVLTAKVTGLYVVGRYEFLSNANTPVHRESSRAEAQRVRPFRCRGAEVTFSYSALHNKRKSARPTYLLWVDAQNFCGDVLRLICNAL